MLRKSFLIFSFLALMPVVSLSQDSPPRKYVVGFHLVSSGGMASSQIYNLADILTGALRERYGFDIELKTYPSYATAVKDFFDGKIDGTYLGYEHYAPYAAQGKKVRLFLTGTIRGQQKFRGCLWGLKDRNYDEVDSFKGAKLIASENAYNFISMMLLREMLKEAGSDVPLWNFFDGFIKVSGGNSAMLALSSGRADLFWSSEHEDLAMRMLNQGLAQKMERVYCTSRLYGPALLVLSYDTIDDETFSHIEEVAKDFIDNMDELANEHPALKSASSMMKKVKGEIAFPNEDHFDSLNELCDIGPENGWMEEANYIVSEIQNAKNGELFKVKPSLDLCKKKCGDDSTCIVGCLE